MSFTLNRIILFVNNVELLKCFYQKKFGFQLSEEIENEWAVLQTGNCEVALHKVGAAYTHNNVDAPGEYNNVKLVFETEADLHQLREQLIGDNIAMREIKSFATPLKLFCDGADPEGNVFQIVQRTI